MRNYHLKFRVGNGDVRYEPAYKAEVVIGTSNCWINGYMVELQQAESAVESFDKSMSLPALGVWDCTLPDGGI